MRNGQRNLLFVPGGTQFLNLISQPIIMGNRIETLPPRNFNLTQFGFWKIRDEKTRVALAVGILFLILQLNWRHDPPITKMLILRKRIGHG